MINKFLVSLLLLFIVSCAATENKTNFGLEQSNINNLTFKDITKIKEYKSCTDASVGIFGGYLRLITLKDSRLDYLYGEDKYEILSQSLIDHQGDSSISSAVKLGGITNIKMIDRSYSITGILGRRYCVIVYGE